MGRLLRRIESIVPRKAEAFGGKVRNLAALARAGFPVPAAYALPGDAFDEFVAEALDPAMAPSALLAAGTLDDELLAEAHHKLLQAPVPEEIADALRRAFRELRKEGAKAVAVRSSSTREDQEAASAAGLHTTVLNVCDEDATVDAARRCWASFFHPRVVTYLRGRADGQGMSMGLLVQAMVPSDVAGVLFTINPLTGDSSEMLINAAYGVGSGVVDGTVSPDTYRVDSDTGAIRDQVLGGKERRVTVGPDGTLRDEITSETERQQFCLNEEMLGRLHAVGRRLHEYFDDPRDVEWALAGDTIYVLQARAVTTAHVAPRRRGKARRHPDNRAKIVWSNVNVGEALPGVASPLTWSVLSNFSELGFRRAFGALGCSVPKDAELFGCFRGRIYLNMTEFMAIASQVPGVRPRHLLELGGGGEIPRLEAEVPSRSSTAFLARLPVTAYRFGRDSLALADRIRCFDEAFDLERRRFWALDLRLLSPLALGRTLRDVERLLDQAGSVMLTAYGNLLLNVLLLRAVLRLRVKDRADAVERGLLTGLADVESAAPGISLWHIAEMAKAEPSVRALIEHMEPSEIKLDSLPEGPTRRALTRFIEAYGHRGVREAELQMPRWREDMTLPFATLRAHLARQRHDDPLARERRQRLVREAAWRELDGTLPPPLGMAVRHLHTLVQRSMRLRERLRGLVTEVLGMFRAVALDASRRLERRNPRYGDDAAFFLTLGEIHSALGRDAHDLLWLVRQRRAQVGRDRALPDPPDTFVGHPPPVTAPPAPRGSLRGLPASSGRAQGLARVARTLEEAAAMQPGEILVVPHADVGLSPLFLAASAVVTDIGGPLSHASVVAREYGVPLVVNVKAGTQLIRTGDRLEVDGDSGVVRLLDADEGAPRGGA